MMRVLLLSSAFNGLSQRAWIELRAEGHDVHRALATSEDAICRAAVDLDPDLIVCPFLRERVPAQVWQRWPTVIIHPGPVGDRGPSSLDWAITDGEPTWGVTALQAVEEMDAGPIWQTRTFRMPAQPPRKSALYNGPVADAAIDLVHDVVAKAADPSFVPVPLHAWTDARGRLRPMMRQEDREFDWAEPAEDIVRRIRAADGSPGVRTVLGGLAVSAFDAHLGAGTPGEPGTIALRRHGAVLVRAGDGAVWVGHLRARPEGEPVGVKLPATMVLADRLAGVPEALEPPPHPAGLDAYRELTYRRRGDVGVLTFDFYNGAMSTGQCRRLASALRHAVAQDTKVLVVGGGDVFSNGIHLNVIEAAHDPAAEGWRNIQAIDDVCRSIITCTDQLVVAAVSGNAGAGGVMLALGADRVLVRDGSVLNPHYETMGLFGSEYWTYVLPRRVGPLNAQLLTEQCLPIGIEGAVGLGLADACLPGELPAFRAQVLEDATRLARCRDHASLVEAKRARLRADELHRPLEAYRVQELAEMSRDLFDDRHGFAAARHAFVTKQPRPDRPRRTGGGNAAATRRREADWADLAG
jgi:putative two-component system hydrogenase maturation factor HypX/HoxX